MGTRTRFVLLLVLIALLAVGLLLAGGAHDLHAHGDAGQPCLACHLVGDEAPLPDAGIEPPRSLWTVAPERAESRPSGVSRCAAPPRAPPRSV